MHAPARSPIPLDTLLMAYRNGIFPMSDGREDDEVFWVEPKERAIIPLDRFHCSRSLRKVLAAERFEVTCNADFGAVIEACAQPRPGHPRGDRGFDGDRPRQEQASGSRPVLHDRA